MSTVMPAAIFSIFLIDILLFICSIDNMIDEVCKRYGFEAEQTINFCRLCERANNYKFIRKKYQKLMGEA